MISDFLNMSEVDEVIIVEEDELEEGEITDSDEEIKVIRTTIKSKELPKRYSLHNRKITNEKCKKDCKRSHHLSYKVKDRDKSTLSKKHKSSCPLQRQKSSVGKVVPKKHPMSPSCTKSLNNPNSSNKSAFKNYTSPPRPVLQNSFINSSDNPNDFSNDDSFPNLLLAYKKCREHLNHRIKKSNFDHRDEYSLSKKTNTHSLNGSSSFPKGNENQSLNEKKFPPKKGIKLPLMEKVADVVKENELPLIENTMSPTMQMQNAQETCAPIKENMVEEESEDEEELRRIALATCAKRTMVKEKAAGNTNNSTTNSPTHSFSNQSSVTLMTNGNSTLDNHDIVDMDLDEENFVEDVHNNMFIIDNKPIMSSEYNQYALYGEPYMDHNNSTSKNPLSPEQESIPSRIKQMNEEVEEAILRAEVFASINKKKISPSNFVPEPVNMLESVSPQAQFYKPLFNSEEQLSNSFEANIEKNEVAKLNNSNFPNYKRVSAPKPRNINATQNRLIITLNNDSSSEESDAAEEPDKMYKPENAVASIDALISNARQRSNTKTNGANLNNVSCLSKAQQAEYKKLRNLLAEKEPMPISPIIKEKIAAEHQHLNFLTNKINVAKEKLDKEVEVLINTEKEVLNKKKVYVSSKLKFQHLQEQLHAAKVTKTANLKSWKVYSAKLVNAKSVVAKQKALLALLETELNNRRLQFEQNSSSPLIQ